MGSSADHAMTTGRSNPSRRRASSSVRAGVMVAAARRRSRRLDRERHSGPIIRSASARSSRRRMRRPKVIGRRRNGPARKVWATSHGAAGNCSAFGNHRKARRREVLERVARQQQQTGHPFGVVGHELLRDRTPRVVPDDDRPLDAEVVECRHEHPGHRGQREVRIALHRRPVGSEGQVGEHGPDPVGPRDDVVPDVPVHERWMHEEDRDAFAAHPHPQATPGHCDGVSSCSHRYTLLVVTTTVKASATVRRCQGRRRTLPPAGPHSPGGSWSSTGSAFFSDAIYAISLTLLVVGLGVPSVADSLVEPGPVGGTRRRVVRDPHVLHQLPGDRQLLAGAPPFRGPTGRDRPAPDVRHHLLPGVHRLPAVPLGPARRVQRQLGGRGPLRALHRDRRLRGGGPLRAWPASTTSSAWRPSNEVFRWGRSPHCSPPACSCCRSRRLPVAHAGHHELGARHPGRDDHRGADAGRGHRVLRAT